jgi:hypothetical protein
MQKMPALNDGKLLLQFGCGFLLSLSVVLRNLGFFEKFCELQPSLKPICILSFLEHAFGVISQLN